MDLGKLYFLPKYIDNGHKFITSCRDEEGSRL
jgi:hypothetical protein